MNPMSEPPWEESETRGVFKFETAGDKIIGDEEVAAVVVVV